MTIKGCLLLAAAFTLTYVPAAFSQEGTRRSQAIPGYLLGPGDEIAIWALEMDEINNDQKPFRIDDQGYISVPVLGRVLASGRTTETLESDLKERVKKFVIKPEVSVSVQQFRAQPISMVGAFNDVNVQNLQGRKTLIEAISSAKGLREDAGPTLILTRRPEFGKIPLPDAKLDPNGSTAEINIKDLMNPQRPELNLEVRPNDIVSVPRADTIYVIGEVQKAGGYVLSNRHDLSVLQALSMAGGLTRMAAAKNARVLRASAGSTERTEVPVDVKAILEGKSPDLMLHPDDILFVPNNVSRTVTTRTLEALLNIGTGIAIFGVRY
jgi:polysaccharide export outer membrane protein